MWILSQTLIYERLLLLWYLILKVLLNLRLSLLLLLRISGSWWRILSSFKISNLFLNINFLSSFSRKETLSKSYKTFSLILVLRKLNLSILIGVSFILERVYTCAHLADLPTSTMLAGTTIVVTVKSWLFGFFGYLGWFYILLDVLSLIWLLAPIKRLLTQRIIYIHHSQVLILLPNILSLIILMIVLLELVAIIRFLRLSGVKSAINSTRV